MTAVKESSTNYSNKQAIATKCPVTFTLHKMGGRWKPLIVYQLIQGAKRYGELRKVIPPITEKMLYQSLKELEADDIIIRTVLEQDVLHVTYSLSAMGQELSPVMLSMAEWGRKYNPNR